MNVFAIGEGIELSELKNKIQDFEVLQLDSQSLSVLKEGDILFFFWDGESIEDVEVLASIAGINLIINSVNTTLAEISLFVQKPQAKIFGIAGIPGFIDRPVWEVSHKGNIQDLSIFSDLGVKVVKVDDRVGMVTPRVICMIINEAFNTVMEGIASKEDIDEAMKLGTNYPEGPFYWTSKIGIVKVYELMESVYEDTKDERYKISPLLKQEYLAAF